jgi:L-amino acid N-acyltransferase YncA
MIIRTALISDYEGIWQVLEPAIRAGDTYPLPREMSRQDALAYWLSSVNEVFVATDASRIVGTFYLRANQMGPGSHVANCGYITLPSRRGEGIGHAMCSKSLDRALELGFAAMQFNSVVSTNESAIRLWTRCGFSIVGRVPLAFRHPVNGFVDIFIMHRSLGALSDRGAGPTVVP